MILCRCDFCGNEVPIDERYNITLINPESYIEDDDYDDKDICRGCLDKLIKEGKDEKRRNN